MKLAALFEYTFPKIERRNVSKLPKQYHHGSDESPQDYDPEYEPGVMKKGAKHLGTGHFSSVYTDPKKIPHDVRKVSRARGFREIDGFYHYMVELSEWPDNGNPYFPRFRAIKIYHGPEGQVVYSAQMEKLLPAKSGKSEREALFRKIFGDENAESYARRHTLTDVLEAVINGYGNLKDKVIDKDLIAAAAFINRVSTKHNAGVDVHAENIMFRRSRYGLQLVITDPLSFSHGG